MSLNTSILQNPRNPEKGGGGLQKPKRAQTTVVVFHWSKKRGEQIDTASKPLVRRVFIRYYILQISMLF